MIGSRLSEERKRLGYKQQDVASALGVSRSAVGMIETEKSRLDAERLFDLCLKLNLDLCYILSGVPSKTSAIGWIDWQLVAQIGASLEKHAFLHRLSLPQEKSGMLIKYLYQEFSADGHFSEDRVADAVRIAT